MPFASAESGSIAAGAALSAAKEAGVESAQIGASLEKASKGLAEIGLYHKAANDADAATTAITGTVINLQKAGQEAPDFGTYQQQAQKIIGDAKAALPSLEANALFDRHMEHYATQSALTVQQKFYKQGVQDHVGNLYTSLDTLSKIINESPAPEQASALVNSANESIDAQVAARTITPEKGAEMKIEFTNKMWYGMVERRAQTDPIATKDELEKGAYDGYLNASQVTHLLDRTYQRINVDNRVQKAQDKAEEMAARKAQTDTNNYYMGQMLNARLNGQNPASILSDAAANGVDQRGLNQLTRFVNGDAERQIRSYGALFQKQLGLPNDIAGMLARKEHLTGVDMDALRDYNDSMATLKAEVVKGSPVDLAGETILNNIKAKQNNPLSALVQNIDQYKVDGFTGDRMSIPALDSYSAIVHAGVNQGRISVAQGLLIDSQINNLKSFLSRGKPGVKPGTSSAAPGAAPGAASTNLPDFNP